MLNLRKDPLLREKLQMDNPRNPMANKSMTTIWYEWVNRKLKREEDW